MLSRFWWITFDVSDLLPGGWQQDVEAIAADADVRYFPKTPLLTREGDDVLSVERGRVHATQVRQGLPWLYDLYHGAFRDLAEKAWREPVQAARDDRYGLVLNVQRGTKMRFECHVDSNPLTGLLFCTDHHAGGELVVSHDQDAQSVQGVDSNCAIIRPQAGHLVFFDVTQHPHYARALVSESDVRIVADMNFYTEASPERAPAAGAEPLPVRRPRVTPECSHPGCGPKWPQWWRCPRPCHRRRAPPPGHWPPRGRARPG